METYRYEGETYYFYRDKGWYGSNHIAVPLAIEQKLINKFGKRKIATRKKSLGKYKRTTGYNPYNMYYSGSPLNPFQGGAFCPR